MVPHAYKMFKMNKKLKLMLSCLRSGVVDDVLDELIMNALVV